MTQETGKSMIRRSGDSRFATRWLIGHGIDIGSGDDSLAKYSYLFPGVKSVRSFDKEDGDAMLMNGVPDNSYDFVHSSHCWEHLQEPWWAIENWTRICKPGGHLIIVVPDFDLYEQGIWPSRFNPDHKRCFSISGPVRHDRHVVLLRHGDFFAGLDVLKIELVERGYRYGEPLQDQSLSIICEPAIEIVARKR